MTRQQAIACMKYAGYHLDQKAYVRLLVESRVNRAAMNAAWEDGIKSKQIGVKCSCRECNPEVRP